MKLISLSLFLLSLLILQFKIVFTAEPRKRHVDDGKKILTHISEEDPESSCNLDKTATTSTVASPEEEEEEEEEKEEEQTETITSKNALELYHKLKLNYAKEFVEIPHFGPYADAMNIFHKIILNTPLPEYVSTVHTPLYKTLEEDLKKTMKVYKDPFVKHINVLKKLIDAELPKINPEHEQKMETQYEKLESLYWNYNNKKMVAEADEAFKDMQWTSPLPSKTNITNAALYHKINKVMIFLKNNVLELDKELENVDALKKCYGVTVQHALLRPLCMVSPVHRMGYFQELESELELFKSHCQKASKKDDGQLPENNNLLELINVVKSMLQRLDIHINIYVKPVLSLLSKEENKGHDMVVNLLSTFFKFLKNENAEKKQFLRKLQHTKQNTKAAINTLMEDEIFLNKINTCSLENLHKFTGISITNQDLTYFSENLKRVAKYYIKILPLLKLKADLLFLLHQINKCVYTEHVYGQETTSISSSVKSVQKINKAKENFLITLLNETLEYISRVQNMARVESEIWSVTSGAHMHRLTRQLQYMMGTACMLCKEMYETSSETTSVARNEEKLKKVYLYFWSARNAIRKFFNL